MEQNAETQWREAADGLKARIEALEALVEADGDRQERQHQRNADRIEALGRQLQDELRYLHERIARLEYSR